MLKQAAVFDSGISLFKTSVFLTELENLIVLTQWNYETLNDCAHTWKRLHFLSILSVKLGFRLSVFWFFVFLQARRNEKANFPIDLWLF